MLKVYFYDEQGRDEQQKCDQHAVTSFVDLLVQARIASVHENGGDDECDQKKPRENPLSL